MCAMQKTQEKAQQKNDQSKKSSSSMNKKTKQKKEQPKKLTLAEKQAIKLKIQKERQAKKAAAGELEPKNKERFYCTSAEMHAELVKWRDSNKEEEQARIKKNLPIDYTKRKLSEEFGRMLMAIADKMLNRSEFRNYSKELKEDAKGFFFVKAIKGLKNYNFEFNNPFSYFSTCAWNAYISTISKHYKQQNIRKDIMKQMLSELETYQGLDPKSSLSNYLRSYISSDETYNGSQHD